jgi:ADP-heptose:LPS heptosyltransferase
LKLLIIRFSSIGDIVLTTPVIRMARLQLKAEVHFLTKKKYTKLLEANPYLKKIHGFDRDFQGSIDELKKEGFDLIIDLHHNLRTFRFKRALGIPSKAFFKANVEKWLMVNFKINKLPDKHIVDRYLETLGEFGIENDGLGLDFYYHKPQSDALSQLPEHYFCLSLGAAHSTKQIPTQKLIELLQTNSSYFVLIGGKDVVKTANELSNGREKVIDLVGKLSIGESAFVIEKSLGLITGDTGMMHIGAALKKKMIVLWGNTIPGFGMFPYYGTQAIAHINYEQQLSCRPCSKTGYEKCPKGHFQCMMNHDMKKLNKDIFKIF